MHTTISLLLLVTLPLTFAFDRDGCLRTVIDSLGNASLSPNSPYFFRTSPASPLYNGPDNVTLTLDGCYALCGPKQTFYADIGPRFITWFLPIFLLIANVELSPLDKRNFYTILHLLGDPIDSIWSLLHKLDTWDICYRRATECNNTCPSDQRIIASVLALHEEIHASTIIPDVDFETLLQKTSRTAQFNEWRRVAVRVADSRTDELTRTIIAFVLYVFQLVAAFVPAVGGVESSAPGGRIAISVLLSWLVPVILLTNAVGSLSSRRIAYNILAEFAANTQDRQVFEIRDRHSVYRGNHPSARRERHTKYFDALPWSGSIYTYRPWKLRYVVSNQGRIHTVPLIACAAAPILIGMAGGILVLWYQQPIGLNCRHPWLITVGISWILSAVFTTTTYTPRIATGVYHWRLTLIKDACIAIPSLIAMVTSVVGLYNCCYCWSGPFQYGKQGHVPLESNMYWKYTGTVYPMIVGSVLGLEVLVVGVVVFSWRRGLALLRWDESTLAREWSRVWSAAPCGVSYRDCRNGSVDVERSTRDRDAKFAVTIEPAHVPTNGQ